MAESYDDIRGVLDALRKLDEGKLARIVNEDAADGHQTDGVTYTSNDELMSSIIETTKAQFGADYSGFTNPMLYYPEDGDVVLSGKIPTLNDMRFQFRYKDQNGGCYVWSSPLTLNKDTLSTLGRIYGVFENWKNELKTSEDIKPMSYKGN